MSSVYTDQDGMTDLLAGEGRRLDMLCDLDDDGDADTGRLTSVIGDQGIKIDARLGKHWPVPFAEIDDSPATPPIIQLIAKHLTAAELYDRIEPDGKDYQRHAAEAEMYLKGLTDGTYTIPGVDPLAGDEGATSVSYSADEPQFSGRDANGCRRWRGM